LLWVLWIKNDHIVIETRGFIKVQTNRKRVEKNRSGIAYDQLWPFGGCVDNIITLKVKFRHHCEFMTNPKIEGLAPNHDLRQIGDMYAHPGPVGFVNFALG
jgi:hypothetical protein